MSEQILTQQELAKRWGVSIETLRRQRSNGEGPKYFTVGDGRNSKIRYKLTEIQKWENRDG